MISLFLTFVSKLLNVIDLYIMRYYCNTLGGKLDIKFGHLARHTPCHAMKLLTYLEGNLSTCHYFAISFDGFGRSKQGLKTVCLQVAHF